jgi:hypothetical protein
MKKNLLLLGIIFLALYSCQPPLGGTSNYGESTLHVDPNFLGLYSDFHQSGNKSLDVEIAVDALGSGVPRPEVFRGDFVRSDDDSSNNWRFPIEVPEAGTYKITVTIKGKQCFDNCSSSDTCQEFNQGKPFFRSSSTTLNATRFHRNKYITPRFIRCD